MKRTSPIGVRFDPDKLDFVKTREKLNSNQQVVDLLINKYWWEHKMPHVTAKEAPPLELKKEKVELMPEIRQSPFPYGRRTAAQYLEMKRELETADQWKTLWEEINGSNLSYKEKQILKTAT